MDQPTTTTINNSNNNLHNWAMKAYAANNILQFLLVWQKYTSFNIYNVEQFHWYSIWTHLRENKGVTKQNVQAEMLYLHDCI